MFIKEQAFFYHCIIRRGKETKTKYLIIREICCIKIHFIIYNGCDYQKNQLKSILYLLSLNTERPLDGQRYYCTYMSPIPDTSFFCLSCLVAVTIKDYRKETPISMVPTYVSVRL